MREASEAEKLRVIAKNARQVAKKEIEKHMNMEEKTEAAKRMEQIDSHMYYDEKDHVDPNEAPEQLRYAPVRNVQRDTREIEAQEKNVKELKGAKPSHLAVKPYDSPPDPKKKSSTLSRSRSSAQKTLQSTAA